MTVHTTSVQTGTASVALIRNWPLTLLSAVLLPLLIGLGIWQMHRADEKAALNAAIDARLSMQPQNPAELTALQAYTPVRLLGYYSGEPYYLDNRTRSGKVGYEILQVFIAGEQRWLVNRGWVAAGSDRGRLPEVHWPLAAKVITGFLYPVADAQGQGSSADGATAARIQSLNSDLTSRLNLAQPLWTIRLSADSDTALVTDWQLLPSPPQRHTAYAVQWFAMAIALVLLWLFAATNIRERLRKK
ncbi:SURF1 family protein [Microbulbifer hainanensis]|uniref:SURF1 family protein n=1 Tax=Microbulbifer hainanensis TaxID=2735675 RepID=UPI001866E6CC|nr:SURF1 family protein [Microbulbifer hainanensis]